MINNSEEQRMQAIKDLLAIAGQQGKAIKEIADNVGVASSSVYEYRKGTRVPSYDIICRVANFLNVEVEILIKQQT